MFLSFLGFGILLLLRAALAQSAPHIYPELEEDEETLIDKLASLSARGPVDPDIFNEFDLGQLDYLNGPGPNMGFSDLSPDTSSGDILAKAALANLPRQFGYRPDDLRFYIPAEEFPNYFSKDAHEIKSKLNHKNVVDARQYDPAEITGQDLDAQEPGPHMKKNQVRQDTVAGSNFVQELDDGSPLLASIPDPAHSSIMASSHSANQPEGPSLTNIMDQPYSIYYIALIAGGSAAGIVGIVAAGICYYRIHERVKAAADVDYPAYGVTGPSKDVSPTGGDRKLAQSAHMYHYQHQKQQMAALHKTTEAERQGSAGSDIESEDDNEEGDYTVYECPGLAPAGEMEVKNPLFQDEPTPASPQTLKSEDEHSQQPPAPPQQQQQSK